MIIFSKVTKAEVISVSKWSKTYRVGLDDGDGMSFHLDLETPPQLGDKFTLTVKVEQD